MNIVFIGNSKISISFLKELKKYSFNIFVFNKINKMIQHQTYEISYQ